MGVRARRAPKASITAPVCASGARMRRIAVHFWPALAVISRAAYRMGEDRGRRAQSPRRCRRSGKGDRVLRIEPVQKIADPPGNHLHRALRHNRAFDHQAQTGFGDITGRGGGLDDGGHPRNQGRSQLFQHPPDRKVKRIDLHRRAQHRRIDMLAQKGAPPAELLDIAIEIDVAIGHLAAALGGEDEHRADAAIDIDAVIGHRRAGLMRQGIERLAIGIEMRGQRFDHPRPVMECQRAQGRAADHAGMVQHCGGIERVMSGFGDNIAGNRALDGARVCTGRDPAAKGVGMDGVHGSAPSAQDGGQGSIAAKANPVRADRPIRQRIFRKPRQKPRQRHLPLHPRQRQPDTGMRPAPKGQMPVGLSFGAKGIGVVKGAGIAIGRPDARTGPRGPAGDDPAARGCCQSDSSSSHARH